jgi:hypothetical protein
VKAIGDGLAAADDADVQDALARLQALSAGDLDRQGFVAREMNRDPALDGLLAAVRRRGAVGDGKGGDQQGAEGPVGQGELLEACCAVNEAIIARAHARTVLREVIYPKLVQVDPKGSGGELLLLVEGRLRAANSAGEVNDALDIAIQHFRHKSDVLGRHGHKKFAAALQACLMEQS